MSPPFARLLPYLLRYKRAFLLGLACVVTTTAIQLLSPWVLKNAIDDLNAGVTRGKLAMYAALLLAIALVGGAFRFLMRRILIGASREIEYDMRNAFFARLQQMPLAYYQARRTGDLMSRATNDLNAVRTMIGPAVMYSANTIIVFVVAIILMASIDGRLTLIALLPLPLVSISVKYFGSAIHTRFEAIQAQLADLSAVVQEALSGVRVVRAYNQEPHEMARFRAANEEYVRRNRVLIRLQGMFYPSMTLFLGFGSLLVLWLGSREAIRGRISVGEFVAFNAYLVMLSWPMIAFGWVTNILQRGMASWKRMLEVLDAAARDRRSRRVARRPRGGHPRRDRDPRPDVHLSDVDRARARPRVAPHRGGRDGGLHRRHRFGQVDAHQPAAAAARAAARHHLPRRRRRAGDSAGDAAWRDRIRAAGAVSLLGHDCREHRVRRRQPAGPSRRRRSLDARIRAAAAIARLDKDVETFPKGYDTLVGERGITLSGGQKQRTAIARALMVDPRLLILDDALSAVDTYTEEEILTRLRGVMRQRTSLIVSHRVSTVRDADRIFVLDRGRIVEQGRHDELVARGGLYATLHRRQLLEEELAAS